MINCFFFQFRWIRTDIQRPFFGKNVYFSDSRDPVRKICIIFHYFLLFLRKTNPIFFHFVFPFSFFPVGPPDNKTSAGLVRRSSSHDTPRKVNNPVCRQVSCPQQLLRRLSSVDLTYHTHQQTNRHLLQHQDHLEDAGWAERRRVRMIQRH